MAWNSKTNGPRCSPKCREAGIEHRLDEELRVQEVRVWLSGLRLVPHLAVGVHRDPVPHLAHAPEVGGERGGVLREHLGGERIVEAGVDADGAEQRPLRVFREHLPAGARLGVLPVVDEPFPPGVVPGRRAEVDAGRNGGLQPLQLLGRWRRVEFGHVRSRERSGRSCRRQAPRTVRRWHLPRSSRPGRGCRARARTADRSQRRLGT